MGITVGPARRWFHDLSGHGIAETITWRVIVLRLIRAHRRCMTTPTNTTAGTTTSTEIPGVAERHTIIDAHLIAYALADRVRRDQLIDSAWDPDGSLIDPPFDGHGHTAIGDMTDVVLAHYPGHHFERTTAVDAHHCFARYGWALVAADGSVAMTGTDVAEFAADGRLLRIVGFFGELEATQG
jgi:hypothetical protein